MQFDAQIQSITQDYIVPKVVDQTLPTNVMSLVFLSQSRPWQGETFKFPVKLTSHTQGGSFNDFGGFNVAGENTRQLAQVDPRAYYQSIALGGIQMTVNGASKTQVLSLIKLEMQSAHQDMGNNIATLMYGTGSNGTDFLGMAAGTDDGTGTQTYLGLDRNTYTAWKSSFTNATSIGAWDFSKARTIWNNGSTGGEQPTFAVVDKTTYGYVESDYQAVVVSNYNAAGSDRLQMTAGGKIIPASQRALSGQAGFDALYYAGTPIVRDEKCTANTLWAVNGNHWFFYGADPYETTPIDLRSTLIDGNNYDDIPSTKGFGWTGFRSPTDSYTFVGQILLVGNFFTNAPRLSTAGKSITS